MHDLVGAIRVRQQNRCEEVFASDFDRMALSGTNKMVRRVQRIVRGCVICIGDECWVWDKSEALFLVGFDHRQKFGECDVEGGEAMP